VTDLLDIGSKWLADQRAASAASLVSYQRGEQSIQLSATPGKPIAVMSQSAVSMAFIEDYTARDWLVSSADMMLDGEQIEPQPGDKIVAGNVTWIVGAEANEKCWRFSDPYGYSMRIHTKQV